MKFVHKIIVLLLLVPPQVAQLQGLPDWAQEENRLEDNRQRWENHNIHTYSFLMDGQCFGCNLYYPARVLIEDNDVVAVLNPETGEPLRRRGSDPGDLSIEERNRMFKSVDGLFTIVESAILDHEGTSHPGPKSSYFVVEYDEHYGYPRSISVEYSERTDAAGNRYTITEGAAKYDVSDFISSP